jgi:threonine dehydrogenase-like Zn-dependent dehydrogenase
MNPAPVIRTTAHPASRSAQRPEVGRVDRRSGPARRRGEHHHGLRGNGRSRDRRARVAKVAFIGSTEVGKLIVQAAAGNLKVALAPPGGRVVQVAIYGAPIPIDATQAVLHEVEIRPSLTTRRTTSVSRRS